MGSARRVAIPPGLVLAVTGIGASDIISSTVGGARFGSTLLWALLLGAALKLFLTEGLARWQLATGLTALEGWARYLPRWVLYVFTVYLILWSIAVSGALTGACGLAMETLTSGVVSRRWGALAHGAVAVVFLWHARSGPFAAVMKPLIGVMIVSVVGCAVLTFRDPVAALQGVFVPRVPAGSLPTVLSLVGGIGGSLTLLGYNYLLREDGLVHPKNLLRIRRDLYWAYGFTAMMAMSVMLVAHRAFFLPGLPVQDSQAVRVMANQLAHLVGPIGFYVFVIGFWAAVVASLMGVWEMVPQIYADCYSLIRRLDAQATAANLHPQSNVSRVALLFMAAVSLPFLFLDKPVSMVILFTIIGSFVVPFLAATLLALNRCPHWHKHVPRQGIASQFLMVAILVLYAAIGISETVGALRR